MSKPNATVKPIMNTRGQYERDRNLSGFGADRGASIRAKSDLRLFGSRRWLRRANCHLLDLGELLLRDINA